MLDARGRRPFGRSHTSFCCLDHVFAHGAVMYSSTGCPSAGRPSFWAATEPRWKVQLQTAKGDGPNVASSVWVTHHVRSTPCKSRPSMMGRAGCGMPAMGCRRTQQKACGWAHACNEETLRFKNANRRSTRQMRDDILPAPSFRSNAAPCMSIHDEGNTPFLLCGPRARPRLQCGGNIGTLLAPPGEQQTSVSSLASEGAAVLTRTVAHRTAAPGIKSQTGSNRMDICCTKLHAPSP